MNLPKHEEELRGAESPVSWNLLLVMGGWQSGELTQNFKQHVYSQTHTHIHTHVEFVNVGRGQRWHLNGANLLISCYEIA